MFIQREWTFSKMKRGRMQRAPLEKHSGVIRSDHSRIQHRIFLVLKREALYRSRAMDGFCGAGIDCIVTGRRGLVGFMWYGDSFFRRYTGGFFRNADIGHTRTCYFWQQVIYIGDILYSKLLAIKFRLLMKKVTNNFVVVALAYCSYRWGEKSWWNKNNIPLVFLSEKTECKYLCYVHNFRFLTWQ